MTTEQGTPDAEEPTGGQVVDGPDSGHSADARIPKLVPGTGAFATVPARRSTRKGGAAS